MNRRKGFTLIELLVVIAILAILAAILFPVFARAREKARQSNCLSNVKQLMLAVQQYVTDYDQAYPLATIYARTPWTTPDGTQSTDRMPWFVATQPYIQNIQILNCPSVSAGYDGGTNRDRVGYGLNGYIGRGPIQQSGVNFPAECMCIAERAGAFYSHDADLPAHRYEAVSGRTRLAGDRHNEGLNIGFCDGHAKWLQSSGIPDDIWAGEVVSKADYAGTYASRYTKPDPAIASVFWVPQYEG